MFSPRSRIVVMDLEADAEPGWDSVLRELATEPGVDLAPAPAAVPAPRGFGGTLDLLLIAGAVATPLLVSALTAAVFLA